MRDLPMDTVQLSFTEEEWIESSDAKVTLTINVGVEDANSSDARTIIQDSIKTVHDVSWRFLVLNRYTDNTGREGWQATVEHRVDEKDIPVLRKAIKEINKPGLKIKVTDVDFSPNLAVREAMIETLRKRLYDRIDAEIKALNEKFPDQGNFRVGAVLLNEMDMMNVGNMTRNTSYESNTMMATAMVGAVDSAGVADEESASGINISQKMTLVANVTLSATVKGTVAEYESSK